MKTNSLQSLKRMALRHLETAELILKQWNPYWDKTEAGNFTKTFRRVIGPWNSPMPSWLQLKNTASSAQQLVKTASSITEAIVLHSLAELCDMLAGTVSATDGQGRIMALHRDMLRQSTKDWPTPVREKFDRARRATLEELADIPAPKVKSPTRATQQIRGTAAGARQTHVAEKLRPLSPSS